MAGGRIWFSIDQPLTFLVNPGPALVEPSVTNPADPNINIKWSFAEFTFNSAELFANISYVDFVCLPISLTLYTATGSPQHVSGIPSDGLERVCNGLRAQSARDGRRWQDLIVQRNGQNLRALSPNNGIILHNDWFATYWPSYVDQVWARYSNQNLTVNTQAGFGSPSGRVINNVLTFGNITFQRPTSADIFSCSTGPFATGSNAEKNAIIPRLAAGFNRSTLLLSDVLPAPVQPSQYYQNPITNHYSRIVHNANLDGRGYAFPYDDVTPDGGRAQEGFVRAGDPRLFVLAVGGFNSYV